MLTERDGTPQSLRAYLSTTLIPVLGKMKKVTFHFRSARDVSTGTSDLHSDQHIEVHHFPELCICLAGQAEMWVGAEASRLLEGEVLVIPPGVPHSAARLHCVSIPPARAYSRLPWVSVLPNGAVLSLCESLRGKHRNTRRQFFLEQHISVYVQDLIHELEQETQFADLMATCHLIQALTWVCRGRDLPLNEVSLGALTPSESNAVPGKTIVGRAKNIIHRDYHARLDLDTIARSVFTNKSHLCREFKRETGLTVFAYLTRLRVDAGKRLLQTGLKISVIAELVGFEDPFYFSRVFKKVVGISPTEYRTEGWASDETWVPEDEAPTSSNLSARENGPIREQE